MKDTLLPAVMTIAALGISSTLLAQTAEDILARHVQARGGYERIKAIQSVKITRTVVTQFAELEVVILKKRPQSYRVEQSAPGQPPVYRAVTPAAVWDLAGGKLTNRTPPAAAEARDLDGDFDGPLVDWKEKGHTVEFTGREALPGGEAFTIQLTTKNGVARTFYIDATTYLVRRITGVTNLPGDRKANLETDILAHKEAGGVKFPADIQEDRTGAGPVQTVVSYTKAIEVNVPIDDGLFAPPASAAPIPGRFDAAGLSSPGAARADRRESAVRTRSRSRTLPDPSRIDRAHRGRTLPD
jgi:hypothetical protein